MTDPHTTGMTRRSALFVGAAAAGSLIIRPSFADPKPGGTLNFVFKNESPSLVATNNTSATAWTVGPKIFDALLSYDYDLTPKPQLAVSWVIAADGLSYTFKLRPGVKWHDGQDFTSADVAFSILLLKQVHPRGRGTYANVVEVQTPDPLTAIIVLSKPAPYLITALAAIESPIVAKHLFEGTDYNAPPADALLVGTGPFVFKEYVRGSHIILDRNPNYWDRPKPYVDRVVMQFITDAAARSAGFESGGLDLGGTTPVPLSDLDRFKALPQVGVDTRDFAYSGSQQQLVLNLDNAYLANLNVRQAIAHAIDLKAVVNTVYYGYAKISPSPISVVLPNFNDPEIKPHSFDLKLANQLLDQAGFQRGSNGTRFPLRLLYNSSIDPREADFLKQAVAKIGIDATIEAYDFGTYVTKAYTDRAFDLAAETLSNTFDPTLGVQRIYWSKNFKVGLPFSNGSHYSNPKVDQLLEAAAVEPDVAKRKQLFFDFQKIIDAEVPVINLAAPSEVIVYNKRVHNYAPGAEGLNANFADLYLQS